MQLKTKPFSTPFFNHFAQLNLCPIAKWKSLHAVLRDQLHPSPPPFPNRKNCPTHLWIVPTILYNDFKFPLPPTGKLLQVRQIWKLRYGTIHCFLIPPVLLCKPLCQAIHLTPRLSQLPISLLTRQKTNFKAYPLQESY